MARPDIRRELNWLQCARAFASLYVASFHASGRIAKAAGDHGFLHLFAFGNAGVDLFFVISGFIIAHVHAADVGRPDRFARYVWRRTTRIYPPYWVLFFCIMPLYFVFPSAGEAYQRAPLNLFGALFLVPVPPKTVIGIAWSLLFEMLFYSMFALAILNRRFGKAAIAVWLLAVVANIFFPFSGNYYVAFLFSPRILSFAAGMGVWYLTTFRPNGLFYGWLALGGAILLVAAPHLAGGVIYDDDPLWLKLVYLVCSGAVVLGAVAFEGSGAGAPKWLVALGDATYSIYLFHWVVGWALDGIYKHFHLYKHVPPLILFLAMWFIMVSVAFGIYQITEKPLLNLSKRLWEGWHVTPQPRTNLA